MFVRFEQCDPANYAFRKHIDEQAHLDTDKDRHQIKSIIHIIDQDFKGEEHKYCDPSQLDATGKFRRPKKLQEAEQRGFKNTMEMMEADKVDSTSEITDLKKKLADLTAIIEKIPKKYLG